MVAFMTTFRPPPCGGKGGSGNPIPELDFVIAIPLSHFTGDLFYSFSDSFAIVSRYFPGDAYRHVGQSAAHNENRQEWVVSAGGIGDEGSTKVPGVVALRKWRRFQVLVRTILLRC